MRGWLRILFGMLASVALANGAEMPASKPEVRKAVIAAIDGQLGAFRKGDVAQAHRYASAGLRAQKPLKVFAQIVQANYPEVWANSRAEFGIVRDNGARATMTVPVYSKEGDAACDCTLAHERVGWKISGVGRHVSKRSKA